MSVYFCIGDVLDRLESSGHEVYTLDSLIDVSTTPPDCNGFPVDAFLLSDRPALLDLNGAVAINELAVLLENVPLYHFNMQLALDEALLERTSNAALAKALQAALGDAPLPETAHRAPHTKGDDYDGSLHHPMLEHMSCLQLCTFYIQFLRALGLSHRHYSFERNILGKHMKPFVQHFDGYLLGYKGRVQARILLDAGVRLDHDFGQPLEKYIAGGQEKARALRITDAREMLWAWLEADAYQMRRCRDIHRVKFLPGLTPSPQWIRSDIFALLEKEAMKQFLAVSLLELDPGSKLLSTMPALKRAVLANADDQVDELLQQLLSQTLNVDATYAGAAGKFAEAAGKRMAEAKAARFI